MLAGVFVLSAAASTETSKGPLYSARDLPAVLDAKPVVDGWSFRAGDSYIYGLAHAPAFTLREWLLHDSPTSAQRTLAGKLKKAGFLIGRHKVWTGEGPRLDKYSTVGAAAVFFALLFRDSLGAGRGFRALRPTIRPAAGDKSLPAEGLGQEAWGGYASGEHGNEQALYVWRRANLVVIAFMDCGDRPCGNDPGEGYAVIQPAARAYADEIDTRAKRKRSR